MGKIQLDEVKIEDIENFLFDRFERLDEERSQLDIEIGNDISIYNSVDDGIEQLADWKEKGVVPYLYMIVQSIKSRLQESLFGRDNYLKIYSESAEIMDSHRDLEKWLQSELDKTDFQIKVMEAIESALVERISWLHLRPTFDKKNNLSKINFNFHSWFDVWFDTNIKNETQSDYFIRKVVYYWELLNNKNIYIEEQLEKIKDSKPPDENMATKQKYEDETGVSYYDTSRGGITDKVEILEYYGVYDISFGQGDPKYEYVIFTIANREILIRAEKIDINTQRKILLFPIVPIRQSDVLIGKSVPQLVGDLQRKLNFTYSHLLTNFRLNSGLLWKYRRNAGIDFEELNAEEGNAVGWEDDINDISTFPVPNIISIGVVQMNQIIQFMQQITGAVEPILGTGTGGTDTARGIQTLTNQAVFKFNVMARNISYNIIKIIKYIIILWSKYGREEVIIKYPSLKDFISRDESFIEENEMIDISLNDLSARREAEQQTFIQASQLLVPLLQNIKGDLREFTKTVLEQLKMPNIDKIIGSADTQQEAQMQAVMEMLLKAGGQEQTTAVPSEAVE